MDALSIFLDDLKKHSLPRGNLLGFLYVLIGRTITRKSDRKTISKGLTWRELAGVLKKMRWDPDLVRELGIDPDALPPRDRQRFWYSAIAQAKIDSAEASKAGERFIERLVEIGYEVGS